MNCYYCGVKMKRAKTGNHPHFPHEDTKDHLTPVHRGGKRLPNNTVRACYQCNLDKGHLTLEEYRLVVAYRRGDVQPIHATFPGEVNHVVRTSASDGGSRILQRAISLATVGDCGEAPCDGVGKVG